MIKDIEQTVKEIIVESLELSIDFNDIKNDAKLIDFGINSINFIKLLVEVETVFDIEFNIEMLDLNAFETVEDLVKSINKMKNLTNQQL